MEIKLNDLGYRTSFPGCAVLAVAGLMLAQEARQAHQPGVRRPGTGGGQRRMTTADGTIQYLQWKKDVADHDYAAASGYLSIRFGESRAQEVSEKLRKLPVIQRRANDILRATQRVPLPLSDPGVLRDLQKVLAGEKLSPVLDSGRGYRGRLPPGLPRLRARPLRGRAAQARLGPVPAGRSPARSSDQPRGRGSALSRRGAPGTRAEPQHKARTGAARPGGCVCSLCVVIVRLIAHGERRFR